MIINKIDDIEFKLNKKVDFSWVKKHGKAFMAIDQTGSGCVLLGTQKQDKRYFLKIAGADTTGGEISPKESIKELKSAMQIYIDLKHPNLIELIEHYEITTNDNNTLYVAVFSWAEGECLFDHWNFEKYESNPNLVSPKNKFKALPTDKKLKASSTLFSFIQNVNKKGYTAVDFYDGSIMYDFNNDKTTICDIDFFKKAPLINNLGELWWGTKRLKAPEEYILNAKIDERTNVFTLGAILFDFFGAFSEKEISDRYKLNKFSACTFNNWSLNKLSYEVLLKATSQNREERYACVSTFYSDWQKAVSTT